MDADEPRPLSETKTDIIGMLVEAAKEIGVNPGAAIKYFLGSEELADYRSKN